MWRTWPRRIVLVLAVFGVFFALVTAPGPDAAEADSTPILSQLAGMTDQASSEYLAHHPAAVIALADSIPDQVADWWNSQSRSDRAVFVRYAPTLIGDLDGVDYRSRDQANRIHLKRSIAAMKRKVTASPTNATDRHILACFQAIQAAADAHSSPRRYLIALTDDVPPLAAIAVGNLDTAALVTFAVPGMGTYTDDMQLWTQSAQNVYAAQGRVGAPKDRAVVSWIGYKTPPPGIAATLGDYAALGAPRLVADLEGFKAVRADSKNVTLNVIAHSYGTTMAADALASEDLGIYSFVMLGSAGIEDSIRTAAALHARHVYAGEAARDGEARFGRFTRQDPRSPSFGATVLSVDGDKRLHLLAVTGHDPVLHSAWNDDIFSTAYSGIKNVEVAVDKYLKHFETFGYLDDGTESLRNTAIATTPGATATMTRGR